jgi:dihydrofolate synthase/folylpolyglutamate synthase
LARRTDYEQKRAVTYSRQAYDLTRMRALLEALGHPEAAAPVLHVAGTKGKGSTAAMAESMLRAAGYRTGLYTSPHVGHLGERIAVDGSPSTQAELGEVFGRIEDALEQAVQREDRITFFEVLTALAWRRFREAGTQVNVIEVGLGGRLDATNVCAPAVCAITSIGLEHTAQLGTTLAAVAGEKAGIIKAGVPCVVGPLPSEALAAVQARADQVGARLVSFAQGHLEVTRVSTTRNGTMADLLTPGRQLRAVAIDLLGDRMADNAALAVAATDALCEASGWPRPSEDSVRQGLASAFLPGRFQTIEHGGRTLVLDGAHTEASIRALVQTLRAVNAADPWPGAVFIVGVLGDKDLPELLGPLAPIARHVVTAPCGSPREVAPDRLVAACQALHMQAEAAQTVNEAVLRGLEAARELALDTIVVCGSLYLVGTVLGILTSAQGQPSLQ